MTQTFPGQVAAVAREAAAHARIGLTAPDELLALHQAPGQYLMVTLPGFAKPRPMALANAPGAPLEILFRDEDEAFPRAGAAVTLGAPSGPGFPLTATRGRDLLLVGTGSAIAPLVAVVRALLPERGAWGRVDVVYGARDADRVCYRDLWREAARADVATTVATTRGASRDDAPWTWASGRVQSAIPSTLGADTTVFVCGQREMMDEVTALVGARGIAPARVHRNF